MSSILKALKKVEEAAALDAAPADYGLLRQHRSRVWGLRRAWPPSRRAGLGLLLALLLAAGVLGYAVLRTDDSAGGKPAADAAAAPAEFRAKVTAAPGPAADSPRGPAAKPAANPAGAPAENSAPDPVELRADPVPPAPRPRPFAARKEAPAPAPAALRPAVRPSPVRSAEDGLARLDESRLKVMAIAWADDPARRIAVVNGHIAKEGESVDGYHIVQIRKDDIIVNEGGRSYRVEFNLKPQP